MKILALRCSSSDFTYAVIEGTSAAPIVVKTERLGYPAGYSESEILKWFHQEISAIIGNQKPTSIAIKATEPMVKRSNALETRIKVEGIASLAAAQNGPIPVQKKVKATTAKDLGMKGRAKYLETKLDTSPVQDFEDYNDKEQEAILAGWGCLK